MVTRVFPALVLGTFALLAANCSSDETTVGLAEGCHINSDCNNPLSCTFGKCHKACESTRDCPPGEHCLKLAEGNVCQQAAETNCTFTSQCPVPLKCAVDSKCRVECQEARDCLTGQKCVSTVCADLEEIDPKTMDLPHSTPADGGDASVAVSSEAGIDASPGAGGSAGGSGTDASDGAASAADTGSDARADAEAGIPFHGIYASVAGDDTGAGTSASPYATLGKAVSMAKSGDTIVLQDGTYPTSGPAVAIPAGVNLKAENPGLATLQGQATGTALKLAGSTEITGVVFKSFANVVDFTDGATAAGTLKITDSSFINCTTACLVIPGNVNATISVANADTPLGDGGLGFVSASGKATVSISGGTLKNFTGSGVIRAIDTSKVTVNDVHVTDGTAQAIALAGSAQVTMTNSIVATLAPQIAVLQGTSSLTVKGSDLSIKPAVATPYECIREEGAGSLVLEDTKIHGCSTGINSVMPAILSLLRTEIYNNSFSGMDLGFGTGGKVTITDSKFHDNGAFGFRLGTSTALMDFKMRGTQIASGIGASPSDAMRIDGSPSSTYDFGTLASPGGNTIIGTSVNTIGLRVMMTAVTIQAVGNTWSPSIQGADAQGKYSATGAGMSLDVVSPVTGQNYALPYSAVTLRLAQNP